MELQGSSRYRRLPLSCSSSCTRALCSRPSGRPGPRGGRPRPRSCSRFSTCSAGRGEENRVARIPGRGSSWRSRPRTVGGCVLVTRQHSRCSRQSWRSSARTVMRLRHNAQPPPSRFAAAIPADGLTESTCGSLKNPHSPAVISSSLWGVYDVADEGYLLRRGHVICSFVSNAARHKPPCRCGFSISYLWR
jgi:hypothetical protein